MFSAESSPLSLLRVQTYTGVHTYDDDVMHGLVLFLFFVLFSVCLFVISFFLLLLLSLFELCDYLQL